MIETYDLAQLVRRLWTGFMKTEGFCPGGREKSHHIWCRRSCCSRPGWKRSNLLRAVSRRIAGYRQPGGLSGGPSAEAVEGLGYYNRVRNMQKAARGDHGALGGEDAGHYPDILSLPGIGPYTAGAVASIAFGEAVPAVDGKLAADSGQSV